MLKRLGIFVNPTEQQVHETVEKVGLDYVQYHGNEDADLIEQLGFPQLKRSRFVRKKMSNRPQHITSIFTYLTHRVQTFRGGSGQAFNWKLLRRSQIIPKERVILAGGLNPSKMLPRQSPLYTLSL